MYCDRMCVFSFVLFVYHHLVLCPLIHKAWGAGEECEETICLADLPWRRKYRDHFIAEAVMTHAKMKQ